MHEYFAVTATGSNARALRECIIVHICWHAHAEMRQLRSAAVHREAGDRETGDREAHPRDLVPVASRACASTTSAVISAGASPPYPRAPACAGGAFAF